jgi:hypothetical protein
VTNVLLPLSPFPQTAIFISRFPFSSIQSQERTKGAFRWYTTRQNPGFWRPRWQRRIYTLLWLASNMPRSSLPKYLQSEEEIAVFEPSVKRFHSWRFRKTSTPYSRKCETMCPDQQRVDGRTRISLVMLAGRYFLDLQVADGRIVSSRILSSRCVHTIILSKWSFRKMQFLSFWGVAKRTTMKQ